MFPNFEEFFEVVSLFIHRDLTSVISILYGLLTKCEVKMAGY